MGRSSAGPELANQIAAGEVVERPASVVKELVENAIDAGATRITIAIELGGKRLVRVTDDGEGMDPEDARLAIERHATSKISRLDDLAAITTLGFRGEALPSIASVSHFTLRTRRRGTPSSGTEIRVNGGTVSSVREVGAPTGTSIEVADLFYNIPARRKFLKSDTAESTQVSRIVTQLALGVSGGWLHPDQRGRQGDRVPARPLAARSALSALRRSHRFDRGAARESAGMVCTAMRRRWPSRGRRADRRTSS